ncbi:Hypothetical predicted protein [Lecanosticta acicola]|uniref:Uncharacterized protein n=1 Tax=Lecanosticta acicola TaxID=111012 RepID=A0AAI8YUL0_9PEZI|nr:Hypothetical predicted protein [Lecanosticta acicola]
MLLTGRWKLSAHCRVAKTGHPGNNHCTGGRRHLDDLTKTPTPLALDCYYIDYDGTNWFRTERRFTIASYTGLQSAAELPCLPLFLAASGGLANRDELHRQGQEFIQCLNHRHRYYSGRSLDKTPLGTSLQRAQADDLGLTQVFEKTIESQVIIDFERALQVNPMWAPEEPNEPGMYARASGSEVYEPDDPDDLIEDDRKWDTLFRTNFRDEQASEWQSWSRGSAQPCGDNLMLLPDRVYAFILRTREWACLRCSGNTFRDVKERSDAWNDLKIPESHKHIVRSLIESHFAKGKSGNNEFDLIRDKGKGVIVLLHGVPGVGKVGIFDEAFKSRIHMSLYYKELDWIQTREIWQSQMKRASEHIPKIECDPDELLAFAQEPFKKQQSNEGNIGPVWNGRQIRNAFQSATALAKSDCKGQPTTRVNVGNLEKVAQVSNTFNNYLYHTKHGMTDGKILYQNMVRYDDFNTNPVQTQPGASGPSTYARQTRTFNHQQAYASNQQQPQFPNHMWNQQPVMMFAPQAQQQQYGQMHQQNRQAESSQMPMNTYAMQTYANQMQPGHMQNIQPESIRQGLFQGQEKTFPGANPVQSYQNIEQQQGQQPVPFSANLQLSQPGPGSILNNPAQPA